MIDAKKQQEFWCTGENSPSDHTYASAKTQQQEQYCEEPKCHCISLTTITGVKKPDLPSKAAP